MAAVLIKVFENDGTDTQIKFFFNGKPIYCFNFF